MLELFAPILRINVVSPKEMMMIRNSGRKLTLVSALAMLLLIVLAAHAQSPGLTTTVQSGPGDTSPVYDISKEINIQGAVQRIETVTGPGVMGTHLQLQTAQGVVDAHLGTGAVASIKTLGLTIGQSVSITGMMTDLGGAPVLLARVLTTSNHIFILRNEHGLPARAIMPRGGSSSTNVVKGAD
jgi:hypothetical protein